MEFVFTCPETNDIFYSNNFEIKENNGIQIDSSGIKFLDAKIVLKESCSFCGKKHVYHANELSCPFTG